MASLEFDMIGLQPVPCHIAAMGSGIVLMEKGPWDMRARNFIQIVLACNCALSYNQVDTPGGGGTLIFSSYVGCGPASTVQPQKKIRNFKHPKKYLKF